MGKTMKISILLLLSIMNAYDCLSQSGDKPELQWEFEPDSTRFVFFDTNHIILKISGGGVIDRHSIKSEAIRVRGTKVFITIVSQTSGVYSPFINVFKQMSNNQWRLVAGTHAKEVQGGRITIRADDDNEVILFETESGIFRKLPFCFVIGKSD